MQLRRRWPQRADPSPALSGAPSRSGIRAYAPARGILSMKTFEIPRLEAERLAKAIASDFGYSRRWRELLDSMIRSGMIVVVSDT